MQNCSISSPLGCSEAPCMRNCALPFPWDQLAQGEAELEKWHCPVGGNDLVLCLTLAPGPLDINWT